MERPSEGPRRGRQWPGYVLIALLSFLSGEVALRIYNRLQPSFVFFTKSYNRYRGRPHEVWFDSRLNSLGFMDTEFVPKAPGRHRIVAIGDSFTHGVVPYRYNFLTLAEADLQRTRPDVEIYNMGIPRTGPREYLALLTHEGMTWEPDTVLVSVFMGNDLQDAAHDFQQQHLYDHSYVLSLLRFAIYIAPRAGGAGLPRDHRSYIDGARSVDDLGYRHAKLQAAEVLRASPAALREQVQVVAGYLGQIQRICASRKVQLLVAVLPEEMQLYEPLRQQFLGDARRDDGSPVEPFAPSQMLDDALEAAHIPHVDLLPAMLEAAATTALYKPNDTHWNIAGNALAAREIAAFLRANL